MLLLWVAQSTRSKVDVWICDVMCKEKKVKMEEFQLKAKKVPRCKRPSRAKARKKRRIFFFQAFTTITSLSFVIVQSRTKKAPQSWIPEDQREPMKKPRTNQLQRELQRNRTELQSRTGTHCSEHKLQWIGWTSNLDTIYAHSWVSMAEEPITADNETRGWWEGSSSSNHLRSLPHFPISQLAYWLFTSPFFPFIHSGSWLGSFQFDTVTLTRKYLLGEEWSSLRGCKTSRGSIGRKQDSWGKFNV